MGGGRVKATKGECPSSPALTVKHQLMIKAHGAPEPSRKRSI